MAKKNFIEDNPALQFISSATQEPIAPSTRSEETENQPQNTTAPEGYKLDTRYIEKRTQRVQLLVQPSLWKKAKAKAKKNKQSLNDYIHSLIENDLQK